MFSSFKLILLRYRTIILAFLFAVATVTVVSLYFPYTSKPTRRMFLYGQVRDHDTVKPIAGASVFIITSNQGMTFREVTDIMGMYILDTNIDKNDDFIRIYASAEGYENYSIALGSDFVRSNDKFLIELNPLYKEKEKSTPKYNKSNN